MAGDFLSSGVRASVSCLAQGKTIMRLSAPSQIKGTIVSVQKGATTSHVRVDIRGGVVITSSITKEAVDELALALAVGHVVSAVMKASDVMIGIA